MKAIVSLFAVVLAVTACGQKSTNSEAAGLPGSPILQPQTPEQRALGAFKADDHVKAELANTFGNVSARNDSTTVMNGNTGFLPAVGNWDYLVIEAIHEEVPDAGFIKGVVAIVTLKGGQAPLVRLAKIDGKGDSETVDAQGSDLAAKAIDAYSKSALVQAATPKTLPAGNVSFGDVTAAELDGSCSFFAPVGLQGCTTRYLVSQAMNRSVPDASWTTSVSAVVTIGHDGAVTVQLADIKANEGAAP